MRRSNIAEVVSTRLLDQGLNVCSWLLVHRLSGCVYVCVCSCVCQQVNYVSSKVVILEPCLLGIPTPPAGMTQHECIFSPPACEALVY